MAKFFKQLGFGGKKDPPKPPKPDYSTLKSTSTDSQLACSPTSDRTSTSFATSTSNIGDFETAPPQGSPLRPGTTDRSGSTVSKVKDCCTGGVSPMSASDRLVPSSSGLDELGSPGTMDTDLLEGGAIGGGPNPSATPPRLLDEYSDPCDIRRQIAEEMSGACAVPTVEDDYSVPYEVKKLFKEGQAVGGARRKTTRPAYETYDDPLKPDDHFPSANQRNMAHDSHDIRPKEDYDEPWELQKLAQLEPSTQNVQMFPPHFLNTNQNKTPQLVKKTTIGTAQTKSPDTDGESVVLEPTLEPKGKTHSSTVGQETPDYENTRIPAPPQASSHDPGSDEDGYTRLTTAQASVPTNGAKPAAAGGLPGNYEEPWDLHATTKNFEDKIKAAAQGVSEGSSGGAGASGAIASAVSNGTDRASKLDTAKSNTPGSHEADRRTQEGYEKPWDWKPHQKDDRGQEGYEKPWDWKPHQKDERPPEEYEPPWDNKAKEFDLQPSASSENRENASDQNRESDTRPHDEYDEPWDKKKTTASLAAAGSKENSPKSSQQSSPKKSKGKHLNLDFSVLNAVGEKIDPNIPLEQQGWYHGSIGRVDAEKFLRVHKEGSYLVRMSESNKTDFSLSLKSARGFMHMKIVFKTNKYILGQFSQPFDSIPLMIHHYSVNKLPIRGAEHMSLLHPVINELL